MYTTVMGNVTVRLHSLVNPNDGTINGTDVDHILEVIDDEGNPGNANPKNKAENYSYQPRHGTSLVADLSGNL